MTNIPGWKIAVSVVLISAVIAISLAFARHSIAVSDTVSLRQVPMFTSAPAISVGQIKSQLRATPLQPDLLHGLIAHRVHERGAKVLSKPEREALESLGWQSTVIQLDLLQDGIARNDEEAVLTRIDGLLRRGKQKQPLVNILVQLEQSGAYARGKLVELLTAQPQWRSDFLTAPVGMAGTNAVIARAETLDAMFARGLKPLRAEVAPIVNRLAEAQYDERAETLWRKFHNIGPNTSLPFDPGFVLLASSQPNEPYLTMVYEWRAGQGTGLSARASAIGDNSALLNVRWDGRGAPVMLMQRLVTAPGRFAITVKGSLLDRSALKRIAFVFFCDGQAPVFHDRLTQGPNGGFVFTANEPVSCSNPDMRLVGMSEGNMVAIELEISSIHVARKPAAQIEEDQLL